MSRLYALSKIISFHDLRTWRSHQAGKVVATNGVFDILHAGHCSYLQQAKELGDRLVVGINSDFAVKSLKGPARPVNSQDHRAQVLAALECVDAVCIFDSTNASLFLMLADPTIWVKGSDYNIDKVNKEERDVLQSLGTEIKFIPLVVGLSTTSTIAKINGL